MQTPPQQPQSELVPTRFVWPYGGRQVHVCGSFTNWLTPIPMAPEGSGGGQVFAVVCNLPPGYHQYKFIVDGKWQHEDGQAFVTDPLGNTNNWRAPLCSELFVKRPDAPQRNAGGWGGAPGQPAASDDAGSSGMDWASGGADGGGVSSAPSSSAQVQTRAAGGLARSLAAGAQQQAVPQAGLSSEADSSRARVLEFLQRHTAYELLPESSKVVVLDTAISVRQAFHALFEQGVLTAPLWDAHARAFVGMISPGDFIALLCRLQSSAGSPPTLSELELDGLTIEAWMREAAVEGGRAGAAPPTLVSLCPEDSLHAVAHALLRSGSGSLPMLSSLASPGVAGVAGDRPAEQRSTGVSQLLHLCTMSGVLACLMRHFRGVPNALSLLSQPLGALSIGTWTDGARREAPAGGVPPRPLVTMHPSTPLKTALAMLLQAGVGALPIVDDNGVLLDVYARNDILALARNNAYSQLPLDSISVSQALHYMKSGGGGGSGAAGSAFAAPAEGGNGGPPRRCYTCTRADSLRTAMETLALPGVTRLVCVQAGTQRIEGIVTLSDIASFLFL